MGLSYDNHILESNYCVLGIVGDFLKDFISTNKDMIISSKTRSLLFNESFTYFTLDNLPIDLKSYGIDYIVLGFKSKLDNLFVSELILGGSLSLLSFYDDIWNRVNRVSKNHRYCYFSHDTNLKLEISSLVDCVKDKVYPVHNASSLSFLVDVSDYKFSYSESFVDINYLSYEELMNLKSSGFKFDVYEKDCSVDYVYHVNPYDYETNFSNITGLLDDIKVLGLYYGNLLVYLDIDYSDSKHYHQYNKYHELGNKIQEYVLNNRLPFVVNINYHYFAITTNLNMWEDDFGDYDLEDDCGCEIDSDCCDLKPFVLVNDNEVLYISKDSNLIEVPRTSRFLKKSSPSVKHFSYGRW